MVLFHPPHRFIPHQDHFRSIALHLSDFVESAFVESVWKLTGFFMPFPCLTRSALCRSTRLLSKIGWVHICCRAEWRATSGMHLVQWWTLSRMDATSCQPQCSQNAAQTFPVESSRYYAMYWHPCFYLWCWSRRQMYNNALFSQYCPSVRFAGPIILCTVNTQLKLSYLCSKY